MDTTGSGSTPVIEIANGVVVAAWDDAKIPANAEVYVNRSTDQGASWLASERRMATGRVAGQGTSQQPFLATSGDGAYVLWRELRPQKQPHVHFNIPFGLRQYGTGKPGSGGLVPALDGLGRALIGESFQLDVTGGYGAAVGAFIVGTTTGATPLFGGTLLVGLPAEAIATVLGGVAGVAGAGQLSLSLSLPTSTAFVGLPLFFQLLSIDPGATGSVSMSNGVELWIG